MTLSVVPRSVRSLSVLAGCALVTSLALADGSETLGDPIDLTLAAGTGYAAAGTGLSSGQPAGINLSIPPNARVVQAILYWEGNSPTPLDVPPTDSIEVNGTAVTGRFIGGAIGADSGTTQFLTYRADISASGIVQPGDSVVSVSGLDFDQNNGAGILAVIDEGGQGAELLLRDGSDRAFVNSTAPMDTTVPQLFTFEAAGAPRTATLVLLFSDVTGRQSGETDLRPNRISIWLGNDLGGAPTLTVDNALASRDGEEWDTLVLPVEIPAGETALQVQALSEGVGGTPASFTWIAAALSVPLPANGGEGCTAGYWSLGTSIAGWPDAYPPAASFADVFGGPGVEGSLLDAVSTPGSGLSGLARQSVAALLNAASGGVDYDLSAGEVVDTWRSASAGSQNDIDTAFGYLAGLNAQGCGLGDDPGDLPETTDNGTGGSDDGAGNGGNEPGDPVDPVEPTDPTEPTDPAEPADPADPAEPTEPAAPGDDAENDTPEPSTGGAVVVVDPEPGDDTQSGDSAEPSSDTSSGTGSAGSSGGGTLSLPATGTTALGSVPVRGRSGGGSAGLGFLALLGMVAGIRRMTGREKNESAMQPDRSAGRP